MGANNTTNLSVAEFLKVIEDPKTIVLDVRTPAEFAMGHLERAVNADILNEHFVDILESLKLDPEAPIAVYCHSGARSLHVASILPMLGYKGPIYNLVGGCVAYESYK